MPDATVQFSVSSWQQAVPVITSGPRQLVLDRIADLVEMQGPHRLRVAVDGFTAAGKTSLGHELARTLAGRGRPVLRASLDDFKRPWSEAHFYDRTSGDGYYRNAFDLDAIRRLLLDPARPGADGQVALCLRDPLTQVEHASVTTEMPSNGILIVDGVFACRPEIDDAWDLRIWIEIDPELSVRRGTERDAEMEGSSEEAEALHRQRYLVSEMLYVDEVDPRSFVEVLVDNTDFDRPRLIPSVYGKS